ncbi:hypothetical protein FOZ63_019243 [Perkinsus olseni]|uniref:Uncharacterized protein n=1 Tax=Perkinsus olseni TaxID=32597 RepID=A0A7J6U789_PEROL|nr:hypothetical protein FOZ63_019243 [Perkinsus olseni]
MVDSRRRSSWRIEDYERYTSRLRKDHELLVKEYARLKPRSPLETVYEEAADITTTPVVENISRTPVGEEIDITPVGEEIDITPVGEEIDRSPVVEEIDGTPVVQEINRAPMMRNAVSPPQCDALDAYSVVDAYEADRAFSRENNRLDREPGELAAVGTSDRYSPSLHSSVSASSTSSSLSYANLCSLEEDDEPEVVSARLSLATCSDLTSYRSDGDTGSSPSSVGAASSHANEDVSEEECDWPGLLWCAPEPVEEVGLARGPGTHTGRVGHPVVEKGEYPTFPECHSREASARRDSTTTCSSLESYVSSEDE